METLTQNNSIKLNNNKINLYESDIIKYSGFFSENNIFKQNKKKLHLPSISNKIKNNFHNNNDNIIQIPNLNSYFTPEKAPVLTSRGFRSHINPSFSFFLSYGSSIFFH